MQEHTEGFWVKQLTEEQIKNILNEIAQSPLTHFKKIINITPDELGITTKYSAHKDKSYLYHLEGEARFEDFEISGGHSKKSFKTRETNIYRKLMSNIFGEKYEEDLDKYIKSKVELIQQ